MVSAYTTLHIYEAQDGLFLMVIIDMSLEMRKLPESFKNRNASSDFEQDAKMKRVLKFKRDIYKIYTMGKFDKFTILFDVLAVQSDALLLFFRIFLHGKSVRGYDQGLRARYKTWFPGIQS